MPRCGIDLIDEELRTGELGMIYSNSKATGARLLMTVAAKLLPQKVDTILFIPNNPNVEQVCRALGRPNVGKNFLQILKSLDPDLWAWDKHDPLGPLTQGSLRRAHNILNPYMTTVDMVMMSFEGALSMDSVKELHCLFRKYQIGMLLQVTQGTDYGHATFALELSANDPNNVLSPAKIRFAKSRHSRPPPSWIDLNIDPEGYFSDKIKPVGTAVATMSLAEVDAKLYDFSLSAKERADNKELIKLLLSRRSALAGKPPAFWLNE